MSTLTTLTNDIAAVMNRDDLGSVVPFFSKMGRLYLEKRWQPNFLNAVDLLSPQGNSFLLPSDRLLIRKVKLITSGADSSITLLKKKSEAFVRANSQVLKYYYDELGVGTLGSAPASGSKISILYARSQPDLISINDTNAWLVNAYDVIFQATLMQAYKYQHDAENRQIAESELQVLATAMLDADVALTQSDNGSEPGDL